VEEVEPIPSRWLEFLGVSKHQHFTPSTLREAYAEAGFRDVEAFAYGQTYDVAAEAGMLEGITAEQRSALAVAEAGLLLKQRAGGGPWLFLLARK
jgi:hypothetical protein